MSKIVLIAFDSQEESEIKAVFAARSALFHMPSNSILEKFEIFDVVDSEVNA
jgi:hypothetical protein